jgi:hypothetical protein
MALKTKYSPLQHFSVENLFAAFGGLSQRNKIVALATVGFLFFMILFLPISLFSGKVNSLRREVTTAQKAYSQVSDKVAEYQKARDEITALESQFGSGTAGSLTSRVEGLAKDQGITVDQMREKAPQETDYMEINSIEVKLSNISLSQLLDFIYNLENDKTSPMRVRRIEIKPKSGNRQQLDVSCDVATFVLKKEV